MKSNPLTKNLYVRISLIQDIDARRKVRKKYGWQCIGILRSYFEIIYTVSPTAHIFVYNEIQYFR